MMAHVAEATELSGKVLVWLDASHGGADVAAFTACRFADAFNAEIETLSFNGDNVARAGALTSASLVATASAPAGGFEHVAAIYGLASARQVRALDTAARRYGVPLQHTALDGEAIDRLGEVCASRGPWNVVVLAAPAAHATAPLIAGIFANVSGATGIVAVPQALLAPAGPVTIVAEDAERLPAMLRAASRLKGIVGRVHLLAAADRRSELDELEAHIRLTTANHIGITYEPSAPLLGVEGALDEKLRALQSGFVIARFGGALLPTPGALARTISRTGAPFLLVR